MRVERVRHPRTTLWVSTTRWALLTVALGFVVALLVIGSHATPFRGHTTAAAGQHGSGDSSTVTTSPSALTANTTPAGTRADAPGSPITSTLSSPSVIGVTPASASPSQTTLPQTQTSLPTLSATPTTNQTEQGWLQGPTSISATYSISAVQPRSIVATWTGVATLTLEVTCDGSTASSSGASGLSLVAHGSTCQITLAGPSDVIATSYTLSMGSP